MRRRITDLTRTFLHAFTTTSTSFNNFTNMDAKPIESQAANRVSIINLPSTFPKYIVE